MSDLESDFEDDFQADDTSDSLVTSSDESVLDEDSDLDLGDDSVIDEDDNSDPYQGPWMPIIGDDQEPLNIPFTSNPGPKIRLDRAAKPVDYFRLFISAWVIDLFVKETNRYAEQWILQNADYLQRFRHSRVHQWIRQGNTCKKEIEALISVIINMGLIKKSSIADYWDVTNPSQSTPWFFKHFNRDRFQILLKFLHFADNSKQPDQNHPDFRLYKVADVVNFIKDNFKKYYMPHKDISIDESMVGYRGKTPHLRQYMPNKHHARFGIKLWCLCDATSHYTVYIEVYKGAHSEQDKDSEEGVTHSLVMQLMTESSLLNRGHHVGLDIYFSSPRLFFALLKENTLATGTVRSNRKGLPRQMLKTSLKPQEVCERRKGPLLCVAYKDRSKRPVLLSTTARAGYQDTTNSRGKSIRRPKCVVTYNSSMGGVDTSDARLYAYLAEKKNFEVDT